MGRKRRVLTPELSAVHRWGAELRARRDECGLSLAGLGRLRGMTPVTWAVSSAVNNTDEHSPATGWPGKAERDDDIQRHP